MSEREQILESLEPLFAEAERDDKVFFSSYQCLVFTPAELRELHSEGRFIWGAMNWRLIDREASIRSAKAAVERVKKELADVESRFGKGAGHE